MADETCRVMVGVFGDRARAERAAAELRAGGCGADRVRVLPGGADVGFLLAGLGVPPEPAEYYRREAEAGRSLLVAGGSSGAARAAIGRNCGSVRLPAA